MVPRKTRKRETARPVRNAHRPAGTGRVRLARDFLGGRYHPGQSVQLEEVAEEYELDKQSTLQAFAEFQSVGMVTLAGNSSAIVHSLNPTEMREAYVIRAVLEEMAGQIAATELKGNTAALQKEVEAMRLAASDGDLDAFGEHDLKFHQTIVKASRNDVLLRVWNTLGLELRIRAALGRISEDLHEVVEAHQPIVDALEKGQGKEAGVLLRNHVETFLEYLKKAESDSGVHKALRKDLEGAKDVQQAFFPPESFSIPCISCETYYLPANGIGGDYYDFLKLHGGRWGIAIGDVSGKGIGAALIMASLQASIRAQAMHPHLDLSALVRDVNRLVYGSLPPNFFASLFYGEYEPATRLLKYVNAGHHPPIVVRGQDGRCDMLHLESQDIPVGISQDSQFATETIQLEIDDVLIAYTDGITEAQNPSGEMWGEQKFEEVLRSCRGSTPEQIIENILEEVSAFANGHPQRDDMTLVVMRVQEGCDHEPA